MHQAKNKIGKKIDKAFILAAGKGTRLRPHTDNKPKPMVPVNGQAIIDFVLESLTEAEIKQTIVNLHYKGEVLREYLKGRTETHIIFSEEEELLDTGGGIKKALRYFDGQPFFCVSGDSFWSEHQGSKPALQKMAEFWDEDKMDLLLLLHPLSRMKLTGGVGDYNITPEGKAIRSKNRTGDYMWTSVRICHPRLFENTPDEPFSFLELMDRAEENSRLYALVHSGEWHHISTPDDLENVSAALTQTKKNEEKRLA